MTTSFIHSLAKAECPVYFDALQFPARLTVTVMAPHPDDFDAIAVTLRLLRDAGSAIRVLVLTPGASGVEDGYRGITTARGKAEIREDEQKQSCSLFGLPDGNLQFMRLSEDTDGDLLDSPDNQQSITECLRQTAPSIICLPHGNDTNASHRRVYRLCRAAVETLEMNAVLLLNKDPKTVAMRNDAYTRFGEELEQWKARLLRCHDSQQQRNMKSRGYGFDQRILDDNRVSAHELDNATPFAEVFEIECICPELM